MSNLKLKSLALTKTKIADVEGERRVTFVASTNTEDRDYEYVEISTFNIPVKGGGSIKVSEIPAQGSEIVDVPLLTNHDIMDVAKCIGSVRKAYFVGGELIFEAGISSREYAQDVFKLIEEGHLDNAFSISFRDFDYDSTTNRITNGEIIEVSLVTRGSNKDARVLEVKGIKEGEAVDEKPLEAVEAPAEVVETPVETKTEEEPVTEAPAPVTEPVEESVEAPAETEEATEEPTEEVVETEAVEETKENEEKEETMEAKSIAQTQVIEPAQEVKSFASDYLKSKSSATDFIKLAVKMNGQSANTILKAWTSSLEAKGISGDEILPSQIEQIFFKAWYDQTGVLSTFRTIRTSASAMYAFSGEGEGIRAKGHKKGETKAGQEVANVRRDLKQKIVYKMLAIDLQDLLDDESGELNAFRTEELASRVADEIAKGATIGDGRTSGTPDYRVFDGTRGLFSMKADLDNAGTDDYAGTVATVVANDSNDNLYDKIVKTLAQVREINGQGKVILLPEGAISALKLIKDANGNYIFPAGSSVEAGIEAQIFEIAGLENSGYDVIAYANQGYGLYATNDMVRTQFNTNDNTDVMLVERSVAGSLYGYKACAGYATA